MMRERPRDEPPRPLVAMSSERISAATFSCKNATAIVDIIRQPLVIVDANLQVVVPNRAFCRFVVVSRRAIVLVQGLIAASEFRTPRGHSRSTSILVTSCHDGRQYARFRLILPTEIFHRIANASANLAPDLAPQQSDAAGAELLAFACQDDRTRRAALDLPSLDVEMDRPAKPIDPPHQLRGNQDVLVRVPVPRVDLEELNAPVGVVEEQIINMPEHALGRMHAMADDRLDAAQMRIATRSSAPSDLRLPRNRCVRFGGGAGLDLIHRQGDRNLSSPKIDTSQRSRRQEDLVMRHPIASVADRPTQAPASVVEQQIGNRAKRSVLRQDGVALQP